MTKAANWVLRFLKNERKTFSVPDKGFYCWAAGGGAQNVWSNIMIFKFIVLRLIIYSVSGTILERFGDFLINLGACNLGTLIKKWFTSVSVKNNTSWVLKNPDWNEIFAKWIMKHGVTYSVNTPCLSNLVGTAGLTGENFKF